MLPAVLTAWLLPYKYLTFFLAAVIEGPVVMTFAGFLLKLGTVGFWPIFAVLVAGDLVADLGWYAIGRFYAHGFVARFGRYVSISEALLLRVKEIFANHQAKILFLSKISMGFGFAIVILMTAGMMRVSLRKFLALNLLGQCIWTGVLLSVGYFFGSAYQRINHDLQIISLVAFILAVGALLTGVGRFLRRRNLRDLV